ncbi:MAG TPA: TlpA disulfide reductase family protein [Chryseosolibacter sp.]|nr:TlpA disulfide reductase family protein [Chryseosolibacter sp.]
MKDIFSKARIQKIWQTIKPWAITLVILAVLRYTGLLSGLSVLAGTALFETGVMNIQPERNTAASKDFDYNFSIRDLDDNAIDMNELKGKVIFLNMWATWCGPCRVEMPSIQELYDSVGKSNEVVFVMLSIDRPETQNKIGKYISDKQFTFPVYQPASELPKQLHVPTIPTTFIIDKWGQVRMKKVGTANYATEKFVTFLRDLGKEDQTAK